MAAVIKSATPGVDTRTTMYAQQNTGLVAGEDLAACDAVRIGAGFKVFKATAAGGRFDGIIAKGAKTGQPVTVFGVGTRFRATDADLDPTKNYFLNATGGSFDDAPAGAGNRAVARAVSRHDLEIVRVGEAI